MKDVQPIVDPAFTAYLAVGLIAVFLLIGLRFTYRAFLFRFVFNKPFHAPRLQAMADSIPAHRSMTKAIAAYTVAGLLAWLFISKGCL